MKYLWEIPLNLELLKCPLLPLGYQILLYQFYLFKRIEVVSYTFASEILSIPVINSSMLVEFLGNVHVLVIFFSYLLFHSVMPHYSSSIYINWGLKPVA